MDRRERLMNINKINDIALFLLREGYEFSIFVKDKIDPDPTYKFSQAFVTTAVEGILPTAIWDLVDGEKIIKYDSELYAPRSQYPVIVLPLENSAAIEKYIYGALKLLRQVPCKAIAKTWIKAIEPRKKTKYPYIKGDSAKPSWWPREVEHREPDHLQKADRLNLMCTILIKVLPLIGCTEMVEELLRSTIALSLFKKDPAKSNLINSIFEIPKTLCRPIKMEKSSVEVMDLAYFKKRCKPVNISDITKSREVYQYNHNHALQIAKDTAQTPPPSTAAHLGDHFENNSLSSPVLIDLLVGNDLELENYINNDVDIVGITSPRSTRC